MFAKQNDGRVHYISKWGRWIVWTGHTWVIDHNDVLVHELAKNVARELVRQAAEVDDHDRRKLDLSWAHQSFNIGRLHALVEAAAGIEGVPIDHEQLDTNPELLGVLNGVVNLRTGAFDAGDPADLITMQCPVAWDADADCPRFDKAMGEWFPDPDMQLFMQRLVGQALVGAQRDHLFVIHTGTGGNGKGTFVRIITHILGAYAVEPHMSLLLQSRNDEHATVKASLFRARLAIASETNSRRKLDESSVKNLTGGDRIRARRMREDEWSFSPSHSLWLQTNHLPQIAGRDEGIWRRVRVVPWETSFGKAPGAAPSLDGLMAADSAPRVLSPDPNLDNSLRDEASGILRWMVEGAVGYLREGLHEPEAVKRATSAYRSREDIFRQFADDSGLKFGDTLSIEGQVLMQDLDQWASDNDQQVNKADFTHWMAEHGATSRRTQVNGRKITMWSGAGITSDASQQPEDRGDRGTQVVF